MIKKYIQYIKESFDYEEEDDDDYGYDDFITDDKFRQFLIDNNCYEQYIKNYNRTRNADKKDPIEFFKQIKTTIEYTISVFDWCNTPEHGRFWSNIHDKWKNKIITN